MPPILKLHLKKKNIYIYKVNETRKKSHRDCTALPLGTSDTFSHSLLLVGRLVTVPAEFLSVSNHRTDALDLPFGLHLLSSQLSWSCTNRVSKPSSSSWTLPKEQVHSLGIVYDMSGKYMMCRAFIALSNKLYIKQLARKNKQTTNKATNLKESSDHNRRVGLFCDPQYFWAVLLPLYLWSLSQDVVENFPFNGCCRSPSSFKSAYLSAYLLVS